MSLQDQSLFDIENPTPQKRPHFGLGRFLFRRSRASRRRAAGGQSGHQAAKLVAGQSEHLEDRTLLAAAVFVNDDFATLTNGDLIQDADPNTAGDQAAMFGMTAFATIQEGIDAVDADGTVFITDDLAGDVDPTASGNETTLDDGPGSYVENVVVNKNVTIVGTDGDKTAVVVDGNAAGVVIDNNGAFTVTIGSISIQNGSALEGGGIDNDGDLTVNNSVIRNNTATNGGGISHFSGTLTIENGTVITGNVANGDGGGLRSFTGSITIDDSAIEDNTAGASGGGAFLNSATLNLQNGSTVSNNAALGTGIGGPDHGGGGIFVIGSLNLTVDDSTIDNNSAIRGGGIYSISGSATVHVQNGSSILANTATDSGAGIFNNSGTLSVDDATIMGNMASVNGGGLFLGENTTAVSITNTSVDSNTASGSNPGLGGGGIFVDDNLTLTLDNSVTISNNMADGALGNGGGILVDTGATLTLNSTVVTGNSANRAGGGIESNVGSVTLTNVTLDGNNAGINGGGLHVSGAGTTNVNGGTVRNNVAGQEGGGLWNASGTMTIDGTTISGNSANAGNNGGNDQGGGGVFNIGGTLDIDNATITGNLATTNLGNGGGVMTVGGSVTIDDSTIASNDAARAGGGIENNAGSVTLTQVVLGGATMADGNSAGINGGGLHVSGAGTTTLNGGIVQNNVAAQEGGGLWNSGTGTLTIQAGGMGGTLIDSNRADGDDAGTPQGGGGIFNVGGTLSITDATISNNVSTATVAGNGGGGILIEGGANNTIADTTISDNLADIAGTADGGGILVAGGATLTINGGTISGNASNRAGGGIENNTSTVILTDVTLGGATAAEGNTAGVNGGGLHVSGAGTTDVLDGSVQNNVAGQEGGGLWNATGTMTINGTTISDNVADAGNNGGNDQGGGGVFNIGGTLDIDNATISGNSATANLGNGGGVMTVGGIVTIDNSTISANDVARAGGGIENNNGTVTLTDVSLGGMTPVDGNQAGVNGGGLHVSGAGTTDINGGGVRNNFAGQEGGGLWNGTATMTIDGTSISENIASGDGADQGGGGVFNAGGIVNILNVATISGNVANGTSGSGGGILNDASGELNVDDSVISGNTANRAGGGIEDNSGLFSTVTLTNVNLDDNSAGVDIGNGATAAPGNGGGLHVTGQGAVIINDGTVNNNVAAAEGGGLWNASGDMNVIGTTISGNSADGTLIDQGGGGIFNAGGNVDVNDATLSGNTATSGFGAAVFNEGGFVAIGTTTLQGDVAGGDLTNDSFNIDQANVTIISQGGTDATTVSGGVSDDTFTVTRDTVGAGATLTVANGSTFTVNSDSESLILDGDLGDDDFTVDFGNGVTLGTVTNLSINGDAETSADSLTLSGTGSFVDVAQTTTSAVDGSFSLNTDKVVIDYTSIESIVNDLLEGLSLAQTPDQTIGAGAGSVDILIASSTDDGEIPVLTVGALPGYASFVDNGNGTGVLTLNPGTGDASTNADITVTATIAGLSAMDTFNIAVVDPALIASNNTVFAVNSGNGAVGDFTSDRNFNTGSRYSTRSTIDVSDGSIPNATPAGIFQTTRYDRDGGSELQYAFPTGAGDFEVTLFFAEIYSPVFRTGGRVFDVSIEGVLQLDDFDVFAQAGAGNKGIARTFQVVSDGTLNIDFGHVVENPMVMGITIVDLNPIANAGPQVNQIGPVVNNQSGQTTTINVGAVDPEGDAITLSVTGLPDFASFGDNGNGTGTITVASAATDEGLFGVTVQATSGTPALTDSASFTLNVAPFVAEPIPNELININGGGPALSGDPGFVRDDNFQNGVGLDFRTGANIDTSDASIPAGTPAELFKTVTFDREGGAELQFDVPTQHTGITYDVTLFFVEIYGPAARTGARVFDVSIDGVLVLDNFDVFAAAGAGNRGIARTFRITSDGNVDIDFGHVNENPAVAGVSVRQIDQVFTTP